jgi:hypothetical protein
LNAGDYPVDPRTPPGLTASALHFVQLQFPHFAIISGLHVSSQSPDVIDYSFAAGHFSQGIAQTSGFVGKQDICDLPMVFGLARALHSLTHCSSLQISCFSTFMINRSEFICIQ